MHIVIPSPKNNAFWEWAVLVKKASRPLEIHLNSVLGMERTLVIKLYDAYCLEHLTKFDAESTDPVTDTMEISCGGMKHYSSDTEFSAWFRKTYPNADIPLTVIEEEELKIIDCYYTDLEGNEVAEPKIGDEVYVVLHTENGVGETTDINLSNQTKDFMYNGGVLENDILKDYLINSNEDKIKLQVIAQQQLKSEELTA